ncbi:MAG: thermostable hemolysin [Gammaproteobacteria bacterium]|nr:MAG: thermostable hemolysin [Gammaproteobacteria bacterium]
MAHSIASTESPKVSDRTFRSLHQLLGPGPQLDLHSQESIEKPRIECYVANQFETVYGARIKEFMPLFLSLNCGNQLSAVTGINPVEANPLFLEQYLDSTIEQAIGNEFSTEVNRLSIVEIGNLAATQRGSSQLLFVLLAVTLQRAGFRWITFTATPQVRKTINRLGFELRTIAAADPTRLPEGSVELWGSYYQSNPLVVAGDLDHAMGVISSKRTLSGIVALYCNRIDTLAAQIKYGVHHAQHYFAA